MKTKQGHNFGFKTKNGIVTTKGLNQYGVFSHRGVVIKVVRCLRYSGQLVDLFELVDYALIEDKMNKPLPVSAFPSVVRPIDIVSELVVGDMMNDLCNLSSLI